MPSYRFEYIEKGSKPTKNIEARNDGRACVQIRRFINEVPGRTFVSGSIVMIETRKVPDPLSLGPVVRHARESTLEL